MDIILLQHGTKTQTRLRKCAFTTHHDTHKVVKHHRFYVEWMNFMSHDSNHNVGKGPFVYKQTYLAFTRGLWLF